MAANKNQGLPPIFQYYHHLAAARVYFLPIVI
jgi:hypothetical protein